MQQQTVHLEGQAEVHGFFSRNIFFDPNASLALEFLFLAELTACPL